MRCESQWKTPAWEIMPKRLIGCKGTHYFIKKKTPGCNGMLACRTQWNASLHHGGIRFVGSVTTTAPKKKPLTLIVKMYTL